LPNAVALGLLLGVVMVGLAERGISFAWLRMENVA
jgi:hypothetical protein